MANGVLLSPSEALAIYRRLSRLERLVGALAPLTGVVGTLLMIGRDPVGFVRLVIAHYIVGSILSVLGIVVESILTLWAIAAGSVRYAGAIFLSPIARLGAQSLAQTAAVQQTLLPLFEAAGPAGPPLAGLVAAVTLVLLIRLTAIAASVGREVPILGTVIAILDGALELVLTPVEWIYEWRES